MSEPVKTIHAERVTVSVRQFHEAGQVPLDLEVAEGADHMDRPITEEAMNRPGLALAGFFKHFAHRRIQVVGMAELAYLKSLSGADRKQRLVQIFERHIPAMVLTRGRQPLPEMLEYARQFRIPVLKSGMITSHFINAATIIIEDLASPLIRYQGTMVEIMGIGVLLTGQPGIGKSETALALIERGHSLISDDLTVLRKDSTGVVVASADTITRYHMEIRGLGLIHIPSLFGVSSMRREMRLDMVINLIRHETNNDYDRTGLTSDSIDFFGVRIPYLTIPVAAGRDIANVVEVSALNQKLKQLGHDAAKELDAKLIGILSKTVDPS